MNKRRANSILLNGFTYIFFPLWAGIFSACSGNSQPQAENPSPPVQHAAQSDRPAIGLAPTRLTFTSGIRAILEDRQGNIWFGSHQEGVGLLRAGQFEYFTMEDGLSDNQVRNIYEDEQGFIWFEGGKGVSRYDGQQIMSYRERHYLPTGAWQVQDRDLWFKGDEPTGYNQQEGHPGVYQYDGQRFSFRRFPVQPKKGEANYYSITTPPSKGKEGTLWFGTYGAAIGYKGSDFTIIDNEFLGLTQETGFLHIRSLMEDSQGNLWIGNNGIGVFKYDGKNALHFTAQQKLKKSDTQGPVLDRIFSIGEDTLGNIWFGTVESGAWRYDGHGLTHFSEKDGLPSQQIWTIFRTRQGALWLGGANPSGVYVFKGKAFERIF